MDTKSKGLNANTAMTKVLVSSRGDQNSATVEKQSCIVNTDVDCKQWVWQDESFMYNTGIAAS